MGGGVCTQASFFVFGWWTCSKGEIRIVENCWFFLCWCLWGTKYKSVRTNRSTLHHFPLSDHIEAASQKDQKQLCQQRSFSRGSFLVWFTCSFPWLVQNNKNVLTCLAGLHATCTTSLFTYCAPPPPHPQILHNLCFPFLLGVTAIPRELCKFWGGKKGALWEMCKWGIG